MTESNLPKTLCECIEEWRYLESEQIWIFATDPQTGDKEKIQVPAWLFRGEPGIYPTTYSSMHRFSLSKLQPEARKEVEAVTKRLNYVLQNKYEMNPMYSTALLQHYGLPTELIDLTSSLDAAAAFAAHDCKGSGTLMAFATKKITENATLIDLKEIHFARRPRHQAAFAFFHGKEPDLRNTNLFESLNAKRKEFHGAKHLDLWDMHYAQICGASNTDPTSGLLNKIVEDDVLAHPEPGKHYTICKEAQEWLDARIPWAPIPMKKVTEKSNIYEPAWEKF